MKKANLNKKEPKQEEKEEEKTPSHVISILEKIICDKESKYNWFYPHHQAQLLKKYLPTSLKHMRTHIKREVTSAYEDHLAMQKTISKEKFCLLINGNSGTGKTKLARLIVKRLGEQQIISNPSAFDMWEEQNLFDKLPRLEGAEVIILDDYSGHGKLGILNKLINDNQKGKMRVIGGHEYTCYLKGVIIPTTDNIEKWVNIKTETLRKFKQLWRRTHATLYLFKPINSANPSWKDYKDKVYYVGHIRAWIYETIATYLPHLQDRLLTKRGKKMPLIDYLSRLYHLVCWRLWKQREVYDGGFYDRELIPHEYYDFQPSTKQWCPPNIVKTFKIPSYNWLRDVMKELNYENLILPYLEERN